MRNTVRELRHIGLNALEGIAKATPSRASRVVRELIIRIRLEKSRWGTVDNSRDSQDCSLAIDALHSALGRVVVAYNESLSTEERLIASVAAMSVTERSALIDKLLAPDDWVSEEVPE